MSYDEEIDNPSTTKQKVKSYYEELDEIVAYDVLPPTRRHIPESERDYLQSEDVLDIYDYPAPMIPAKLKSYPEKDEFTKFGIIDHRFPTLSRLAPAARPVLGVATPRPSVPPRPPSRRVSGTPAGAACVLPSPLLQKTPAPAANPTAFGTNSVKSPVVLTNDRDLARFHGGGNITNSGPQSLKNDSKPESPPLTGNVLFLSGSTIGESTDVADLQVINKAFKMTTPWSQQPGKKLPVQYRSLDTAEVANESDRRIVAPQKIDAPPVKSFSSASTNGTNSSYSRSRSFGGINFQKADPSQTNRRMTVKESATGDLMSFDVTTATRDSAQDVAPIKMFSTGVKTVTHSDIAVSTIDDKSYVDMSGLYSVKTNVNMKASAIPQILAQSLEQSDKSKETASNLSTNQSKTSLKTTSTASTGSIVVNPQRPIANRKTDTFTLPSKFDWKQPKRSTLVDTDWKPNSNEIAGSGLSSSYDDESQECTSLVAAMEPNALASKKSDEDDDEGIDDTPGEASTADRGYFSKCSTHMNSICEPDVEDDVFCVIPNRQSTPINNRASHSGFLNLLVTFGKPEYRKTWCILENNSFSCMDSDMVSMCKETIDTRELLGLATIKDSKYTNTFQLNHSVPNKSFVLFADSSKDMKRWMTVIARSIAAVGVEDLDAIADIERGGNIYVKRGLDSEWCYTWIHLVSKTLNIYNKDEEFEEVDLRKAKALQILIEPYNGDKDGNCGAVLIIQLAGNRNIRIRSDATKETEGWRDTIQSLMLQSDGSLVDQVLTAGNVPLLVDKCIDFIAAHGIKTVGIYRLSGQNSKITKLLDALKRDVRSVILRLEDYHVHEVATALKRFFRCLDEPLLTEILYANFIETSKLNDENRKLSRYKYLLGQLPLINYCTMKRLIHHLTRVSKMEPTNKMSITNLAALFGPILMKIDKSSGMPLSPQSPPVEEPNTNGYAEVNDEISVVKYILENYAELFDVTEEDIEQEIRMEKAVVKIEQLSITGREKSVRLSKVFHEDLLLGVFIIDRNGDVVNIKVPVSMSALNLQNEICKIKNLQIHGQRWSIFEVICNGQLERPIHFAESVLEVILAWNSWPIQFCKDNYICFKRNDLYETLNLMPDIDTESKLCTELKLCRSRTFHKQYFEISDNHLSYRKHLQAASPTAVWQLNTLVIYIGIQKERTPPTKWGMTFYFAGSNPQSCQGSSNFGFSLCYKTEEEMHRWLSAMLHSQHPEGILASDNSTSVPTVATPQSRPMLRALSAPALPPARHTVTPPLSARLKPAHLLHKLFN